MAISSELAWLFTLLPLSAIQPSTVYRRSSICRRSPFICLLNTLICLLSSAGLDPAGPLVSAAIGNSLTTDSAVFVQVLHTSSIGVQQNIGHADFYANRYALAQPNCELDDISCSHSRSTEIYYASCFPEYQFVGTSCAECHPSCGTAQFGYNTSETHGCFQFPTSGCFGYALN